MRIVVTAFVALIVAQRSKGRFIIYVLTRYCEYGQAWLCLVFGVFPVDTSAEHKVRKVRERQTIAHWLSFMIVSMLDASCYFILTSLERQQRLAVFMYASVRVCAECFLRCLSFSKRVLTICFFTFNIAYLSKDKPLFDVANARFIFEFQNECESLIRAAFVFQFAGHPSVLHILSFPIRTVCAIFDELYLVFIHIQTNAYIIRSLNWKIILVCYSKCMQTRMAHTGVCPQRIWLTAIKLASCKLKIVFSALNCYF
jgi:hypothetical protein